VTARPARRAPGLAAVLVLLCLIVAAPPGARAGTEEFSTFSVEEQERDDESLLDHLLTRAPGEWEGEWTRAPLAIRTRQGCLTAGQWFTVIDLKLRTSMGERAWMGVTLTQSEDDTVDYQFIDLSLHVPTRWGTPFLMFRPFHDKARQDFAVGVDVGADTSAFQASAVLGLEDLFNNLWAFRQTTLGEVSQPYIKHPFEPALRLAVRQPRWRAEIGGRYLTPGVKRVIVSYANPDLDRIVTLWGTYAWWEVGARALGADWTVSGANHQASTGEWMAGTPEVESHDYRRQWWVEASARRPLGPRWAAEARWLHQERTGNTASPVAPRAFGAIDRATQLELSWRATPAMTLRAGGLLDRITAGTAGVAPEWMPGSRRESRAYVGLALRFGRVTISGVEGFELDREPYEVSWVHDKGFVQLQATF
jgi:hypothetical protein